MTLPRSLTRIVTSIGEFVGAICGLIVCCALLAVFGWGVLSICDNLSISLTLPSLCLLATVVIFAVCRVLLPKKEKVANHIVAVGLCVCFAVGFYSYLQGQQRRKQKETLLISQLARYVAVGSQEVSVDQAIEPKVAIVCVGDVVDILNTDGLAHEPKLAIDATHWRLPNAFRAESPSDVETVVLVELVPNEVGRIRERSTCPKLQLRRDGH